MSETLLAWHQCRVTVPTEGASPWGQQCHQCKDTLTEESFAIQQACVRHTDKNLYKTEPEEALKSR